MITVKKAFRVRSSYDLSRIGPPEKLLFFDIETTGLSAAGSQLYLIGTVSFEDGGFVLRQWFAQSLSDEQAILRAFFAFSESFEVLVSFNGDAFDLRYLSDCAAQYRIPCPLSRLRSFDILKQLRKRRGLLGLPNYRQKTVESFLGLSREDPFTGGELISVYEEYAESHGKEAEHFLLLHNEEDIKGMPEILSALSYGDALTSDFEIVSSGIRKDGRFFECSLRFPMNFPVPLEYTFSDDILLRFSEDRIDVRIALLSDRLKYFYPDYRNYYYLPVEGYAIHRKLASFVDRQFRKPATAATCFTLMEGFFVPALKNSGLPQFYLEYRGRESWHLLNSSPEFLSCYLHCLFGLI